MNSKRYVFLCGLTVGCVPAHLARYRDEGDLTGSGPEMTTPTNSSTAPSRGGNVSRLDAEVDASQSEVLDKSTRRYQSREDDVWDNLLAVLIKNYNITLADRKGGLLTTEWDTFYAGSDVYRNRVSVRVVPIKWGHVEVTLFNNVERLDSRMIAGVGGLWLPAEDPSEEVPRIFRNVATLLGQPSPTLSEKYSGDTKVVPAH